MTQELCQGSNHDALCLHDLYAQRPQKKLPVAMQGDIAALSARTQSKDISNSKTYLCRQQERPKMNEYCGSREGKAHSGEKEE